MTAISLAVKRCTKCGEHRPLTEFHRDRNRRDGHSHWCKTCVIAAVTRRAHKRRDEMGDDEYLRHHRATVARSRARTGNAAGKQASAARNAAIRQLIANHRSEFDRLVTAARYELERQAQ